MYLDASHWTSDIKEECLPKYTFLQASKRMISMLNSLLSFFRLESEKGRGSRFTVEIPMNTADTVIDEEKSRQESRFERSFSMK
ncbi:hypothetical protein [Bacteroides acidifaciens]|nr:hypothetical protein [Bacteroides acidifaciens]